MTVFLRGRNTDPYRISFARVLFDNVTLEQVTGTPPVIGLSTTALTPTASEGANPPDDTFIVRNTGGGTLDYTIGHSVSWLSVSPSSGTSDGEGDTITVTYSIAGLLPGIYYGSITVSDPKAADDPQTVAVALTVTAIDDGGAARAEDFESMPTWSSGWDAPWGSAASWSIVSGGQSDHALQAARSSGGSSSKVRVFDIEPNTEYTFSVYMRCPSWSSSYWAEVAYRLGDHSARSFDENADSWAMVKKFSPSVTNGNGDVWTQYSQTFASGSNTRVSVGFKLGSTGSAPTVAWDTLRIE